MSSSPSNSSKTGVDEFTISATLKLAEVCLESFSFQDGIDLICLAVKLLFVSIHQWLSGTLECSQTDDEGNKTDQRESLKKDCIQTLAKKVESKLKNELQHEMPSYYKSDALSREFKVLII